MVVGLGTGSTAAFALEALARRVAGGLQISGIPTSEATAAQARRLGIPLTDFAQHRRIDLTIDGADEIERRTLHLIKGRGGALLREKIVASASRRVVIVADHSKLVDRLGERAAVPVEIVPFGWQLAVERLEVLGATVRLRRAQDQPFRTDGGNYIADCAFPSILDAPELERRVGAVLGVIESGLFIDLATGVVLGTPEGPKWLRR